MDFSAPGKSNAGNRGLGRLFFMLVLLTSIFLSCSPLLAQEQSAASPVDSKTCTAHLSQDTVWGRFESPSLQLTVSNPHPFPVTLQFDSADFRLSIDKNEFLWRIPDTVRETTIPAKSPDHLAFVLRLDNSQWRAANDDNTTPENSIRLAALNVGRHQIKIRFKATAKDFSQAREIETETSLEVVADRLAPIPLRGVVTDHSGQPVSGAKLFLIGNGYMQVRARMKKDFSFAEIKPTYMIQVDRYSGFQGNNIEPDTESDTEGRYRVVPRSDSRAILVLCDQAYPHVMAIESLRQPTDIRLPQPGKLTIEFESPKDAESSNLSVTEAANLAAPYSMYWLESAGRDLVVNWSGSGSAEQVKGLACLKPGTYRISRSIRRVVEGEGGRSYSKVVDQRDVEVRAGEAATINFAKRNGRQVTFQLTGEMVDELAYATLEVYPRSDEYPFDRPSVVYDFGTSNKEGVVEVLDIEPGNYRAWVTGYRAEEDSRGRTRYKTYCNGIAEFEIDNQGSLPVEVNVEMLTFLELSESSGYRLPLKFVDADESAVTGCMVNQTTIGFNPTVKISSYTRSDQNGEASMNLPHGDHRFYVYRGNTGHHKLVDITTPVMGQQEIKMDPQPSWIGDPKMAEKVKIDIQKNESTPDLFTAKITNLMDEALTLDQSALHLDYLRRTQHQSAFRWKILLNADHSGLSKQVEPGETLELQFDWNDIVLKANWTDPQHIGLSEKHRQFQENEFVILFAGPGEAVFSPRSPFQIAREAKQKSTGLKQ